jgi:imidazoleglycerol-phosphate dehydratase
MLTLWARHGLFDLQVEATGDTEVDLHHTVEDVGICLGRALADATGDKMGMVRYGSFLLPMDEALVMVALDFCGRPYLEYSLDVAGRRIGAFEADLGEEFFRAVASAAGMTLHIRQLAGRNSHHILEAAFKGFGRAVDAATSLDPRVCGVPSTKGLL